MALGFAPAKTKQELTKQSQSAQKAKLTPIAEIQANLSNYFAEIKDPRVKRTKKHLLTDILVIAILAVIAGAEGWEDIENYARQRTILPSPQTYGIKRLKSGENS